MGFMLLVITNIFLSLFVTHLAHSGVSYLCQKFYTVTTSHFFNDLMVMVD